MSMISPATPAVQTLLAAAGAYALSTTLTPLVRKMAVAIGCVSRPADDRWGRRVVPRLGGIPIGLGFLLCAAWAVRSDPRMAGLLAGGILILLTGLVDDFKRIHPNSKLIAQILAGCAVSLAGIQVSLPAVSWLAVPLTIGWLVLVMNAFNLMDNMDGLSAGIGAIAAFFCAWQALQTGQVLVAVVAGALTGATLGFLQYNLPPARIFMGDTGSQVLGLGLGALALMQTWHHSARLLGLLALPTLLLAVPIFDTLFVTVQRMTHGRHPFQGGTDHLSHRLGVLGLNPLQVVLTFYALAGAFGFLSIFLAGQNPVAITGILLFALGGLLLLGAYLAKVRVYAAPTSAEPPASRFTLIETMLMHKRRVLEVAVDFAFVCGCYVAAYALRFEAYLTPDMEKLLYQSLPWVIAVKISCLFACGLYRGVWRYMGVPDLVNILRSVALSSVLSALVVLYLWRFEGFSRAVFIIDGTLLFLAISGARLAEPIFNEWISSSVERTKQVLVIGAGDTGDLLVKQLKIDRQDNRRVAAFLDDDPLKQGSRIHGIPIIGSRRELGRVVKEKGIQEVFIALRRPPEDLLRQVQGYCEENGLRWSVVTSLTPNEPAPRP